MMTTLVKQEEVKAFVNDLTPGQIRTAVEFFLMRSSPLEELIATSITFFEMVKDLEIDEESRTELDEIHRRFSFWGKMC